MGTVNGSAVVKRGRGLPLFSYIGKNGPSKSDFRKNVRKIGTLVYFCFLGSSLGKQIESLKCLTFEPSNFTSKNLC